MPLNEARGFARSNLTKEQKQQAEAAIFGLPDPVMSTPTQLTADEIERMRAIVAQHDNQGKVQEFDLNNPPKQAYAYQEFPRVMYHHASGRTRLAKNAAEVTAAEEAGWTKDPHPVAPAAEPAELDAESAREVEVIEEKRKAARKPKPAEK